MRRAHGSARELLRVTFRVEEASALHDEARDGLLDGEGVDGHFAGPGQELELSLALGHELEERLGAHEISVDCVNDASFV